MACHKVLVLPAAAAPSQARSQEALGKILATFPPAG